jgi:hypothetical protein
MTSSIHLNLDDAWEPGVLGIPVENALAWGPRVRYFAPERLLSDFYQRVVAPLPPFVLYGSGDFHHLAGWLIRRVQEPVSLVTFDNHPDWDVRPPRWACGGWVNRVLALPNVRLAAVWGCGNFELNWPARIFANHTALKSGRLEVHAWAERYSLELGSRFNPMTRENWREHFAQFVERLPGSAVYLTIDLDCLRTEEAVTNWENGLFTAGDVAWAIEYLRARCRIVGGDLCGAYSPPAFERWTQRLASRWDHPKLKGLDITSARAINTTALRTIWHALTASTERV